MSKIKFKSRRTDFLFLDVTDNIEEFVNKYFEDLPLWCTIGQFVVVKLYDRCCGHVRYSLGIVTEVNFCEGYAEIAFGSLNRFKRFYFENGALEVWDKRDFCEFHPVRYEKCPRTKWALHCAKLNDEQADIVWKAIGIRMMETFDAFLNRLAEKGVTIPWYVDGKVCKDANKYCAFYEFDLIKKRKTAN